MAERLSKTRVNRAGERMAQWWVTPSEDEDSDDEPKLLADLRVITDWRQQHAYPIALCMPGLRKWVQDVSSVEITPVQRLKRMPRILSKLARHDSMKLARMQDIAGARAVLGGPMEVDAVAAKIERYWHPVRTSDYRDEPNRETGYRALHLMVEKRDRHSGENRVVEIQLRTHRQHEWADEIERTDVRLRSKLKDGEGPPELVDYFKQASDLLWMQERGQVPGARFRRSFQHLREQVRPYFTTSPSN